MLITATTTSQTLDDMLTTANKATVLKKTGSCAPDGRYLVFLQVLGSNDVYVELYEASTTTAGAKITAKTGEFSLSVSDLQNINIIADGGNSAIRVIITK